MTVIVNGIAKTKKELIALAKHYNATGEKPQVWFVDPSIIDPLNGGSPFYFHSKGEFEFNCTNHPKRSWYATVRIAQGKVEVK